METKLLPCFVEVVEKTLQLGCAASSRSGGRESIPENIAGRTSVPGDTGQVRGQDLALSPELA